MEKLKKIFIPIDIVLAVLVVAMIVLTVLVSVLGGSKRSSGTSVLPELGGGSFPVSSSASTSQAAETYVYVSYPTFSVAMDGAPEPYSELNDPDAYLVYYSDYWILDEWEFDDLSAQELTYARNEIYARHGYVFDSSELNEYFSSKNWYSPNPSWDPSSLSDIEVTNAEMIAQYQQDHNLQYTPR